MECPECGSVRVRPLPMSCVDDAELWTCNECGAYFDENDLGENWDRSARHRTKLRKAEDE